MVSLLAVVLSTPARATFYSVALGADFIVVAIDSRTIDSLHPRSPPDDRYCKIVPLSADIVFFSAGFLSSSIPDAAFDASSLARDIYAQSRHPADLVGLRDRWESAMEDGYMRLFIGHPDLAITNGLLTKGFFGSVTEGRAVLASSEINVDHGHVRSNSDELTQFGEPVLVVQDGYQRLLKSDRAKGMLDQSRAEGAGKPLPEQLALVTEAMVAFIRDWSGDAAIGGEIAVLILEKGHPAHWFRRPSFCTEKIDHQ